MNKLTVKAKCEPAWIPAFAGMTLLVLLLLCSCAETPKTEDKIQLTPVSFSGLPGWGNDRMGEVVPALLRSCAVNKKTDWAQACAELKNAPPQNDDATRAYFEKNFQVFAVGMGDKNTGLFTGYYEPQLHASLQRGGAYQSPLYARPDDLISVDLGDFKQDLHGQHIVGKVDGNKLKPYDGRAEIEKGSLQNRAKILAYADDPVDAFFLAVQGSGSLLLPDGTQMRVGYDGANGRAYVAIGRAMADQGLVEKPVTMQKIRDWLKAHPDRAQEIMNLNPSYVFFKIIEGDAPIGAEGVALTPQRSLAVDPAFVALGTVLWLDTVDGNGVPLQRLMVAQDTGGAIKGAVRGDVFWGSGDNAAQQAGNMQSSGRYYLLLPAK